MKLYGLKVIEHLIDSYHKQGGEVIVIREGVLGYGDMVLTGDGLKTTVINERYINEWSSGHSIRLYNKVPKKYQQIIINS